MPIRINNISLTIDEEKETLKEKVIKDLKIKKEDIKSFKIIRESIDARKKDNIKFIYTVQIETLCDEKIIKRNKDAVKVDNNNKKDRIGKRKKINTRPIVIGFGPAGIFAALTLAREGYAPIVYERGEDVDNRTKTVESFWSGKSELNLNSNVQFGEGGAGAFSDGKLTTRIKDDRCLDILETFVNAGAPEEIIYEGKPHVGTDLLKGVVKNIREEIKSLGGEVCFNSKLEKINVRDKKIYSIIVNGNEIKTETLILAIGHSARDTYKMLYENNVFMEAKPFAIGVRCEHPQELINKSQYGKYANHPRLKGADYRLSTKSSNGRGVYSFCMCPGGVVVSASSEKEGLVTNGMSYHARDLDNANSALVVTVSPDDFQGNTPLSGMEFQRYYEKLAYKLGGSNYNAPIQLIGDFIKDEKTTRIGTVNPSYKPGYEFKELNKTLPSYVIQSLKEGICDFDKKIKGFGMKDGVLIGIETRTSAPVKITRNANLESISVEGLYPAGEGAGFAGGIISAAVDGIKIAENIIKN